MISGVTGLRVAPYLAPLLLIHQPVPNVPAQPLQPREKASGQRDLAGEECLLDALDGDEVRRVRERDPVRNQIVRWLGRRVHSLEHQIFQLSPGLRPEPHLVAVDSRRVGEQSLMEVPDPVPGGSNPMGALSGRATSPPPSGP